MLPEGCTRLVDAPWKLHDAIYRALTILSFEDLPEDEQPPENIWDDNRELGRWFKAVKAKREADADPRREIDKPVQNDAARSLIAD